MTHSIDTTIFDKKPKFLVVFIVTSLIGIILISLAVYRTSHELEVIHEVDNMSRVIPFILGDEKIEQMIQGGYNPAQENITNVSGYEYRFYVISGNNFLPLQNKPEGNEKPFFSSIDLESTRVNSRGGFYELEDNIQTWVMFKSKTSNNRLLVLHTFKSTGGGALIDVYKRRMIIPIFFYIWLMVWVTFIFNHLIHKLKSHQEEMKHMALHDALTGLPNRNLMDDRLLKLIQSSHRDKKKFAFSLIDLDGFKAINDELGHAYGDEILKQTGKRLESVLRKYDTAARLGGDEFIVLLNDIDEHAWHTAFSRILDTIKEPYTLFDMKVSVGVSIGVSIYSVHGDDAETLLRNADHAMYSAKAEGGGIRIFEHKNEVPEKKHRTSEETKCFSDDMILD